MRSSRRPNTQHLKQHEASSHRVMPKHKDSKELEAFKRQEAAASSEGFLFSGDRAYSGFTVIGVRHGNTFYLNENKYGPFISRDQRKLREELQKKGYRVISVHPSQPEGRHDTAWAREITATGTYSGKKTVLKATTGEEK